MFSRIGEIYIYINTHINFVYIYIGESRKKRRQNKTGEAKFGDPKKRNKQTTRRKFINYECA